MRTALTPKKLSTTITAALRENGVPTDRLVLENGEQALDAESDVIGEAIVLLGELGVGLALDDFGNGYLPLTQLAGLPLDEVGPWLEAHYVRN